MSKNYRTGFEKLSRRYTDTGERYMIALLAVKENFNGFTKKAGFDASHPEKLTQSQRHQIRRYYNLLTEYTEGQPVYKMKPSELPQEIKKHGKRGIDAAMTTAHMRQGKKRSKFIFIKYDGENIPEFGTRNGAPTIVNKRIGYETETILINRRVLAENPDLAISSLKPLTDGAQFFRIMAGERHECRSNSIDLNSLAREIKRLQAKYQIGNHKWENWLFGVNAYYGLPWREYQQYENKIKAAHELDNRIKKAQEKIRSKRK